MILRMLKKKENLQEKTVQKKEFQKKLQKGIAGISLAAFTAALLTPVTVQAGEWRIQDGKWWYANDDGSWTQDGWQWIDGNGDGIAESYYFDHDGYLVVSAITPDGYLVNENGAWISGGTVQIKQAAGNSADSVAAAVVGVQVINNYYQALAVDKQHARMFVTLSDGTVLMQDFPPSNGCGWDVTAEFGDVTGDGVQEIVVNRMVYGSTFAATDVFIYQVRNGQLAEHSRITDNSGAHIVGNDLAVEYTTWGENGKGLETRIMHWNGSQWVEV